MEGPRVSGPWLVFRGGNAIGVYRPLIYRGKIIFCLPCGTMFPHGSYLAGDVAAWRASDRIRAAEIAWTRVHAIIKCSTCVLLTLRDPLDA